MTDRPAEIDLSMSIGRRDFSYQRGERVRATLGKWRENQISIRNAYLDARTAPDVRLARDMTRDWHGKTVSPLLNHCFHVSTLRIRALANDSKLFAKMARCGSLDSLQFVRAFR